MNLRLLLALLLPCFPLPLGAIDISDHDPAENDRFDDDPAFIGSSYDWSGVGRTTTGTAGKGGYWATMISSNVFLSANHYHPATSDTLSFYPDNDPGVTPVTRTIVGGQRIGTTDLWIGYFDQALPESVSYYNRATETLSSSSYASSIIADENALTVGITSTSTDYGADKRTSMAVGQNVIDGFTLSLTVSGTTAPAIQTIRDISGDSNLVTHESQLQGGDSGGPIFIDVGGSLQLVGINWAIGDIDIDPNPRKEELRDVSYYSYVGNYSTEIQSYIDAHPASTVPEPVTAVAILIGLTSLGLSRRR